MQSFIRAACRLYPFYSGYGYLSNSSLFKYFGSKEKEKLSSLRNGIKIWVNPNDFIGRSIEFFGDLDPKISWLFEHILQPGDTCVDIGANCGLLSLLAAKYVGEKGKVIAIEPQRHLVKMIAASAKENHFNNIEINAVALSDRDGKGMLFIPKENLGAATVEKRPASMEFNKEEIILKQASKFLFEHINGPIKLMKIDVEGHEDNLMTESKEFLQKNPPQAIIIEVHQNAKKWTSSVSLKLLHDLGYRLYAIPKVLLRMKLSPLNAENPTELKYNDYLALRGDYQLNI